MNRRFVALLLAGSALLVGCGSNDEADAADLSPAALEGRTVARTKGCAACHGSNGGGGIGPAFTGLYGADVLLESGETVVADRDYLVESIEDPRAEIVEGYNVPMPANQLSAEEIDAVIAYIEALASEEP